MWFYHLVSVLFLSYHTPRMKFTLNTGASISPLSMLPTLKKGCPLALKNFPFELICAEILFHSSKRTGEWEAKHQSEHCHFEQPTLAVSQPVSSQPACLPNKKGHRGGRQLSTGTLARPPALACENAKWLRRRRRRWGG